MGKSRLVSFLSAALLIGTTGCEGPAGPQGLPGEGTPGLDGEQGDPGPPTDGDPSISGVSPHVVYFDRIVEVTISSAGTDWSSDTRVDFGDGIEVLNTHVASPTALVATIEVSPDAAEGPRMVTATDGALELTFGGDAFEVTSPLDIEISTPAMVIPGSAVVASVRMLDLTTPFFEDDTGFFPSQMFGTVSQDGMSIGGDVAFSSITPFTLTAILFLDADTPLGPIDLEVENAFKNVRSAARDVIDVEAGPDLSLAPPGVVLPFEGREFQRLELQIPGPAEVILPLTPSTLSVTPLIAVVPESGVWEDALPGTVGTHFTDNGIGFLSPGAETVNIVVGGAAPPDVEPWDLQIDTFLIPVDWTTVTPPALTAGAISFPGQNDYVSFDAQAGQTVAIATLDGATTTCASLALDSYLRLLDDRGQVLFAENDNDGVTACSQLIVAIPVTGTYRVQVSGSPFCGGCTFDYNLVVQTL